MTMGLFVQALAKFLLGVLLVGLLLFLPAGTIWFPAAWRLMFLLFLPMFIAGLILMYKNQESIYVVKSLL